MTGRRLSPEDVRNMLGEELGGKLTDEQVKDIITAVKNLGAVGADAKIVHEETVIAVIRHEDGTKEERKSTDGNQNY